MRPLVNIIALVSLAIITLSSAPVQVNALAANRAQVARHVRGHDAIAKRKRDASSGTCIPRPASSPTPPPPTSAPPPSTSTPTSSATSVAPSPTSSNSKKWGLAFNADPSFLQNFNLPSVGFITDWAISLPANIPSGMTGIPQVWGWKSIGEDYLLQKGYSSIIFGMNEPEQGGQANMDVQTGLQFWLDYIMPHQGDFTLVSPCVTNGPEGLAWLEQFVGNCTANPSCRVDAACVHCYSTTFEGCQQPVTSVHNSTELPIWITEFAWQDYSGQNNQPTMNEVWDNAGKMVGWVDSTDWIYGAAPYAIVSESVYNQWGVDTNNLLMNDDGSPTDLAKYYFGEHN